MEMSMEWWSHNYLLIFISTIMHKNVEVEWSQTVFHSILVDLGLIPTRQCMHMYHRNIFMIASMNGELIIHKTP
jgi:hypothetical protein